MFWIHMVVTDFQMVEVEEEAEEHRQEEHKTFVLSTEEDLESALVNGIESDAKEEAHEEEEEERRHETVRKSAANKETRSQEKYFDDDRTIKASAPVLHESSETKSVRHQEKTSDYAIEIDDGDDENGTDVGDDADNEEEEEEVVKKKKNTEVASRQDEEDPFDTLTMRSSTRVDVKKPVDNLEDGKREENGLEPALQAHSHD